MLKELLQMAAQINAGRRILRDAVAREMASLVMRGALTLSGGLVPTKGELETVLVQMLAELDVFLERVQSETNQMWSEDHDRMVRAYWNEVRVAALPETERALVQERLTNFKETPTGTQTLSSVIITHLLMSDATKEQYKAFKSELEQFRVGEDVRIKAHERELLAQADIHHRIREESLKDVDDAEHPARVQATISLFRDGLVAAFALLELPPRYAIVGADIHRIYSHSELLGLARSTSDLRVCAEIEEVLMEAIRRASGPGDEWDEDGPFQVLLSIGEINTMRRTTGNFVPLMRLFDAVGVDPCATAARVVRWGGPFGYTDEVYWYVYEASEGRMLLVVKNNRDPRMDQLCVYNGGVEEAIAMITDRYSSPDFDLTTPPDAEPHIARTLADAYQAREIIEGYRTTQADVKDFLASQW